MAPSVNFSSFPYFSLCFWQKYIFDVKFRAESNPTGRIDLNLNRYRENSGKSRKNVFYYFLISILSFWKGFHSKVHVISYLLFFKSGEIFPIFRNWWMTMNNNKCQVWADSIHNKQDCTFIKRALTTLLVSSSRWLRTIFKQFLEE